MVQALRVGIMAGVGLEAVVGEKGACSERLSIVIPEGGPLEAMAGGERFNQSVEARQAGEPYGTQSGLSAIRADRSASHNSPFK